MRSLVVLAKWGVGALLATVLITLVAVPGMSQIAQHLGDPVYVIDGGSMEPAIARGALVIEQRIDPGQLKAGDVITARAANAAVYTHRIVTTSSTADGLQFTTKGDANPAPDPAPIGASAVIGRVAFWVPLAGFVLMFINQPMGVVSLASLLCSLMLQLWLLDDIERDWAVGTEGATKANSLTPAELVSR